jgi:hypothetical protein
MGARVVPIARRFVPLPPPTGEVTPVRLRAGGLAAVTSDMPHNSAVPVFVLGRANRCPDCHGEAFAVGRVTADCAGCGLPLAIVDIRRIM